VRDLDSQPANQQAASLHSVTRSFSRCSMSPHPVRVLCVPGLEEVSTRCVIHLHQFFFFDLLHYYMQKKPFFFHLPIIHYPLPVSHILLSHYKPLSFFFWFWPIRAIVQIAPLRMCSFSGFFIYALSLSLSLSYTHTHSHSHSHTPTLTSLRPFPKE
jgi:hypothetical protein